MTWLENDIQDLDQMVDIFCVDQDCLTCPFYSINIDCLADISRRLNRTLDMIKKCEKELSQYV